MRFWQKLQCLVVLKLGAYLIYRILKSGNEMVSGLVFCRGGLHPCPLVHAVLVKTSGEEEFVRKVCISINITRVQRNKQQPLCCTLSPALLSHHQWTGEFITILQVLPKICTPSISSTSSVTAQFRKPVQLSINFSLARYGCPEMFLYPRYFQYPFLVPFFSSELDETWGTEAVSESRNIAGFSGTNITWHLG